MVIKDLRQMMGCRMWKKTSETSDRVTMIVLKIRWTFYEPKGCEEELVGVKLEVGSLEPNIGGCDVPEKGI